MKNEVVLFHWRRVSKIPRLFILHPNLGHMIFLNCRNITLNDILEIVLTVQFDKSQLILDTITPILCTQVPFHRESKVTLYDCQRRK